MSRQPPLTPHDIAHKGIANVFDVALTHHTDAPLIARFDEARQIIAGFK